MKSLPSCPIDVCIVLFAAADGVLDPFGFDGGLALDDPLPLPLPLPLLVLGVAAVGRGILFAEEVDWSFCGTCPDFKYRGPRSFFPVFTPSIMTVK